MDDAWRGRSGGTIRGHQAAGTSPYRSTPAQLFSFSFFMENPSCCDSAEAKARNRSQAPKTWGNPLSTPFFFRALISRRLPLNKSPKRCEKDVGRCSRHRHPSHLQSPFHPRFRLSQLLSGFAVMIPMFVYLVCTAPYSADDCHRPLTFSTTHLGDRLSRINRTRLPRYRRRSHAYRRIALLPVWEVATLEGAARGTGSKRRERAISTRLAPDVRASGGYKGTW